jgi:hypothetical protein
LTGSRFKNVALQKYCAGPPNPNLLEFGEKGDQCVSRRAFARSAKLLG